MNRNIFTKVANFYKKALIINDMAKRIMYSLIPSVNDNRIDYKALKYAIEGMHDIIKYGLIACKGELKHYGQDSESNRKKFDILQDMNSYLDSEDYLSAATLATNTFGDHKNWAKNFGGYAWEKIAKSIKSLVIIRKGIFAAKKEGNIDLELDFMKEAIIELNIFDGLAHNTNSIMKNLINIENEDYGNSDYELNEDGTYKVDEYGEYIPSTKEPLTSFKEVKEMMDSKELTDPIDVYKEIETNLIQSGNINRYKDYIYKLRNHPTYKDNSEEKINNIKVQKALIILRKKIKENNSLEHLEVAKEKLKRKYKVLVNSNYTYSEISQFNGFIYSIHYFIDSLSDVMSEVLGEINDINSPEVDRLKSIQENIRSVVDKTNESVTYLNKLFKSETDINDKTKEEIEAVYELTLMNLNKITFILSDI